MAFDKRWLRSEPTKKARWTPPRTLPQRTTFVPWTPPPPFSKQVVGTGQGESEYGPFDPPGYPPPPDNSTFGPFDPPGYGAPDQSILDQDAQAKLQAQAPSDQQYQPLPQPQQEDRGWPGQVSDWASGASQGLAQALPGAGFANEVQRRLQNPQAAREEAGQETLSRLQQYGGEAWDALQKSQQEASGNTTMMGGGGFGLPDIGLAAQVANIVPGALGGGVNVATVGQPWTSPAGEPMGPGDIASNFIDPDLGAVHALGGLGLVAGMAAHGGEEAGRAAKATEGVVGRIQEGFRQAPELAGRILQDVQALDQTGRSPNDPAYWVEGTQMLARPGFGRRPNESVRDFVLRLTGHGENGAPEEVAQAQQAFSAPSAEAQGPVPPTEPPTGPPAPPIPPTEAGAPYPTPPEGFPSTAEMTPQPPVASVNLAEHPNPAIRATERMLETPESSNSPDSWKARIEAARTAFVRAWTDRDVELSQAQGRAQKALGGNPLPPDMLVSELKRLAPDPQAEIKVNEGLRPILQNAGELYPVLRQVLIHSDNLDVAKNMGLRARNQILENRPRPPLSPELQVALRRAQGNIDRLEGLLADANADPHPSSIERADKLGLELNDAQDQFLKLNKQAQMTEVAGEQRIRHEAVAAQSDAEQFRKFSGGTNVQDSENALALLERDMGPQRWARVQRLAQQTWDYADQLRQRLVDAGVWTPERAEWMRENYPHYTPTRILDFMNNDRNFVPSMRSMNVTDDLMRRATIAGTERAREDPIASLIRATYETERTANKNTTFNALLKVRDADPQLKALIQEVPSAGLSDLRSLTREERKVRLQEHADGQKLLDDPAFEKLTGFVDGDRVTYAIPKAMASIIKNETHQAIPGAVGAVWNALMSGYRMAATTLSPAFLAGNAVNDFSSYMIREAARSGKGPLGAPRALADLSVAYLKSFRGLWSGEYKGDAARFLREGGGQFGFFSGNPSETKQTVAALRRGGALEIHGPGDAARIVKDILTLRPVQAVGERIELAPRLAAFTRAERRGLDTTRAVIAGRDVTLDFARGGEVAKVINQFIPFFNAGMQGSVTPFRAFKANPRGLVLTMAGMVGIPTMVAEAWNRGYNLDGSRDEQRGRDYADVPDYVKQQGIVVMLPNSAPIDAEGNRRPNYVYFRLREWAPAAILAREAAARAAQASPTSWQELVGQMAQASSPVQGASSFIPPAVALPTELGVNKDFYRNRDIATKGADARASALGQVAAGPLTGVVRGVTGDPTATVHPSQVDFAARGYGSGIANAALGAANLIAGQKNPQAAGVTSLPVVGGLASRFVGNATGQRLQDIRDNPLPPPMMQILRDAGITQPPAPPPTSISPTGLPGSEMKLTPVQQENYNRIEQVIFNNLWSKLPPTSQRDASVLTKTLSDTRAQATSAFQAQLSPDEIRSQTTMTAKGDSASQKQAIDLASDLRDPKQFPEYVNPQTGKTLGTPADWARWDQVYAFKQDQTGKALPQPTLDQMRYAKQAALAKRDAQLFDITQGPQGPVIAVKDARYQDWNRWFGVYQGLDEATYQSYLSGKTPRYRDPVTHVGVSVAQADAADRWLRLYRDTPPTMPLHAELRPKALAMMKWLTPQWEQQLMNVDKADLMEESGVTAEREAQFARTAS